MATTGGFFKSVFIIAVAAAIVMLGGQELKKHNLKKSSRRPMPDMVKVLHGEVDIAKGNIADQAQQQRDKSSDRAQYEAKSKASDTLEDDDRSQLKQLLDKLSP